MRKQMTEGENIRSNVLFSPPVTYGDSPLVRGGLDRRPTVLLMAPFTQGRLYSRDNRGNTKINWENFDFTLDNGGGL